MTAPGWYPDPLGGPGNRYWNGDSWDGVPAAEDHPPDEPHRGKTSSKARLLVPVLVLAVGVMGGMLLMLLWPKNGPDKSSEQAPVASSAVPPTTTSTLSVSDSAAATVRKSMQHDLDNDPNLGKLGLKVVDVKLVNKSGNEYRGIATVETRDGAAHDVPVDVTADGTNVLWETPPGAFIFAREQPPPPSKAPSSTTAYPAPSAPVGYPSSITGTCNQLGKCSGVQQRVEPRNNAPQLTPVVLAEGAAVTIACQTNGELKTEVDHAPSSLWYRLANGAYVNSIYVTPPGAGIPACA